MSDDIEEALSKLENEIAESKKARPLTASNFSNYSVIKLSKFDDSQLNNTQKAEL